MSAVPQTAVELRRALAEARAGWSLQGWLALAAVAVVALVPFLSLPGVRLDALANTLYLALAATALGLTVGSAGLPSLGTGAFMAIGAFTSALLVARSGWPVEPAALAGAAAALVAGLLSGRVVRLRRAFVAVSTWLLAWLVWLFLLAFPSVSGGSQDRLARRRRRRRGRHGRWSLWALFALEPGEHPGDDPLAAERQHEHEQDRGHGGVEPLERQVEKPGERPRHEADQPEDGDPGSGPERRGRSAEQDSHEKLE